MKKEILNLTVLSMVIFLFSKINAQIQFAPHTIVGGEYAAPGAQSVYAVDLDGDGDTDILSASAGDNKIVWYEPNYLHYLLIEKHLFQYLQKYIYLNL